MYGMRKTTIYLTDQLKTAVERVAAESNQSEAEVIRTAVSHYTASDTSKRPAVAIFDDAFEPISHRVDELLAQGFGLD